MIDIWAFDFVHAHGRVQPDYGDPAVVQAAYDFNLANLARLEEIGFTGAFLSEHHFSLLTPNPNLFVAALAQRTSTLRLGVMGNVLPFHPPWRLAEDLAMLDYLTHGRLEIGLANGAGPGEPLMIGIDVNAVRPMSAEAMDIIAQAQAGQPIDYAGEYYSYKDIPIVPPPLATGRRRTWMTVQSAASARAGARRGYKICSGFQTVEAIAATFDAYREEAGQAGIEVGPDDLGIRREVLLRRDDAEARDMLEELATAQILRSQVAYRAMFERFAASKTDGIARSGVIDAAAPAHAPEPGARDSAPKDRLRTEDEFLVGSPQTVAEQIRAQCHATGAGHFLAYHFNSMTDDEVTENYALWGEVIEILRASGDAR